MKRRDLPIWPSTLDQRNSLPQLSAKTGPDSSVEVTVLNRENDLEVIGDSASPSLLALQPPPSTHPPSPRRQPGGRSGTRRRASKKPRNRRGGWKPTTGLTWSNVQDVHEAHHGAAKAGMPLNRFVSIRPPSHITDDATRKKLCYRLASHIGQKLRRRGAPFIAIRVFEKDIGGLLHLHMLVHVQRRLMKEFSGWGDLIVTDIRPAAPVHIGYITKQRHPLPPDLEKVVSHQRKKGVPFKGRRWSLTPDLKALLAGCKV